MKTGDHLTIYDLVKIVLSAKAFCPSSGLIVYGLEVPPHRVNLQGLENGMLMGYCPAHQTRWFIGDRGMCADIRNGSEVIDRLYPKVKKPKEKKNGEA